MSRRDHYEKPDSGQATQLADAFRAVTSGDLDRAANLARPLGYKVVRFLDRPTGRKLVLLVEQGARRRGWGLYAYSPGSRSPLIVEVAHPKADIDSEKVGVAVFRRANAADLLMAGTHRYAASEGLSDVAHSRSTPFNAVSMATVKPGSIVLQPHGFEADVRGSEYGQIVVSSGGDPTPLVKSLVSGLRADGYKACLHRQDVCTALGGTTNVEGRAARASGASFVHLEMALPLREDPTDRQRIASTVARVLR